ncbi:hypothetical protein ASG89_13265 [Paenibacillus sp. Soil766]|nr:hypothetical protein ASG89_13265 [Paenibacillus sp. Soil766]
MIIIGISVLILLFIGGVHMYWAFGGRWGSQVATPTLENSNKRSFRPGRAATVIVSLLLVSVAVLLSIQGQLLPFPSYFWVTWGCWISVFVFALRTIGDFKYFGVFKRVKGSRFAKYDTFFFTPLCIWLSFSFYYSILRFGG